MNPLATIGYEAATLDQVLGRLKAADIEIVIDVRAVASSRRAGFSKTLLAASLNGVGIDYLHLRGLGTPKAGRDAARKGHVEEMRAIYRQHLHEPQAQAQLIDASKVAGARRAALLCYEADAAGCHRAIVADLIHDRLDCPIVDL